MKKNLIFIFCLFFFNSCKKNAIDALPPVTQNGANTFGCLVNGKPWVSTGKPASLFNRGTKAIEGGYILTSLLKDSARNNVSLMAERGDGTSIDIYINNVYKPGIYPLIFDTGTYPANIVPFNYGVFFDITHLYLTNSSHKGTVIITKADTITNAVAGTFEFNGFNNNTQQTILVTNGRFDFLYKP